MAENQKKKQKQEEKLPEAQSLKKANKKMNLLYIAIMVSMFMIIFSDSIGGDGVFVIAALLFFVVFIVYIVKILKNRVK